MCTPVGKSIRFVFPVVLILSLLGTAPPIAAAAPAAAPQELLQFRSGNHVLGFAPDGMYAATPSHALHVEFVGARAVQPRAEGAVVAAGGRRPLRSVTYDDVWPGVDLTYGTGGTYTTTYTVAPHARVSDIQLRYEAPIALNADGSLSIGAGTASLVESAPIAWQMINGSRVPVEIAYRVQGQQLAFSVGKYDARYALIIDPTLVDMSFIDGNGNEYGHSIAVSADGHVWVAGQSDADADGRVRPRQGGIDAIVTRIGPNGPVWSTFLGGGGDDIAYGVGVDPDKNVYVVGESSASWTCITGETSCIGTGRAYAASLDGFYAKLDAGGHLLWNTFLGGSGDDRAYAETGGPSGLFVAGRSQSAWGCAADCTVRDYTSSGNDGFAASIDRDTGALLWNTFLGSSSGDSADGIAMDAGGNLLVVGSSKATWGSPFRAHSSGDNDDAFVAKLSGSGGLTWNTFLGGPDGSDEAHDIVWLDSGSLYVVGYSYAAWDCDPTCNLTAHSGGGYDAFVTRLTDGGVITWNTFLGAADQDDQGYAIATDTFSVFVVGDSNASWGDPLRPYSASLDGFAAKLNQNGALVANVFLGGTGEDMALDVAADTAGKVYVSGNSTATWGNPHNAFEGPVDAYAAMTDFRLYVNSTAAHDGWILESGEDTSLGGTKNSAGSTFYVGADAGDKQYRAILSFDTSALPDNAVIQTYTLKIKKAALLGSNPFGELGRLLVDVHSGSFSNNTALQLGDFGEKPTKGSAFSVPSKVVKNWYSKTTMGNPTYISRTGFTQMRLRFALDDDDDLLAEAIKFYSGSATSTNRPLLIIKFTVP